MTYEDTTQYVLERLYVHKRNGKTETEWNVKLITSEKHKDEVFAAYLKAEPKNKYRIRRLTISYELLS